jgi:hypothetical protein
MVSGPASERPTWRNLPSATSSAKVPTVSSMGTVDPMLVVQVDVVDTRSTSPAFGGPTGTPNMARFLYWTHAPATSSTTTKSIGGADRRRSAIIPASNGPTAKPVFVVAIRMYETHMTDSFADPDLPTAVAPLKTPLDGSSAHDPISSQTGDACQSEALEGAS